MAIAEPPFVFALKAGLWVGKEVVKLLERAFPALRDDPQNKYGIDNYYLSKFNLTNTENFKRSMKQWLALSISVLFWLYAMLLADSFLDILSIEFHAALLLVCLALTGALFLFGAILFFKWSYLE